MLTMLSGDETIRARPLEDAFQGVGAEIHSPRYGLANGALSVGPFKSSLTRFKHYQAVVVAFTQHIFNLALHA